MTSLLKELLRFSGTMPRKKFVFSSIFLVLMLVVFFFFSALVSTFWIFTVYMLLASLSLLSLTVRRMRDTGHSIVWLFMLLIPILNLLLLVSLAVLPSRRIQETYQLETETPSAQETNSPAVSSNLFNPNLVHIILLIHALFVFYISLKYSTFLLNEFFKDSASATLFIYILFVFPFAVLLPTTVSFAAAYIHKSYLLSHKSSLHLLKLWLVTIAAFAAPYGIMCAVYIFLLFV